MDIEQDLKDSGLYKGSTSEDNPEAVTKHCKEPKQRDTLEIAWPAV